MRHIEWLEFAFFAVFAFALHLRRRHASDAKLAVVLKMIHAAER
jgi:hypothetical protein